MTDPAAECFNCGAPATETFGNGYLCADCADALQGGERPDDAPEAVDDTDSTDVDLSPTPTIEADTYPEDLLDVHQWLAWKPTDDGRKVPRAPYEHRDWPDKFVSAQNPDVWRDFETVREWCDTLAGYQPAFNIRDREEHPDEKYVLVDYDDARDPETEEIHRTVREHIDRAGSYADVSTSGTGVHIFARGALPEGVKAIEAELPTDDRFPDAEIEVYDSARFSAMTGDHIATTPVRTTNCQAFLDELADEFTTVATGTPDELLDEPEKSREELADVETTDDIQDVLDAIQHTGPRDIRLRSPVTHERGDGTKSLDPVWASSKSGTRLAQVDDGWVYRKGMHGLDALQVVALEERIITSVDEYPSGEDFWTAVDALRDRGAHIPEFEPSDEAVAEAVLPDQPALRGATSGWDWRHASSDVSLTIGGARERTVAAIADAYEGYDRTLIEALPTMGKSYGAVKAAAETDTPISILTGRGRKEQYEQFREWCEEFGLSYKTLPAFIRDCDTANGEHGAEWADTVRSWYHRGATPQAIHKWAEDVLGRPLPCQEHEGHQCPYAAKWDFDPDDYDVLIGHYSHAHKSKVTAGRVAVFDEFPGSAYETDLGADLQRAVSYWLGTTEDVPFDDYTDLIEHRDDDQRRSDALAWFLDDGLERDELQVFDDANAHAAAPLAVFTLLASDDLGNGFEKADLDDVGSGVFDRSSGRVTILQPPALEYASGVVALDGTPTQKMWELALGEPRLNHRAVLQEGERAEYIRDALNLNLVRTTDAVKSYSPKASEISTRVSLQEDRALLEGIVEQHDERPALITTARAEEYYDEQGVLDLVDATKHHGNVLGSNEFDDTRLGAVIGSRNYGPQFVKKWGAYAGETVDPTFPSPENDFTPTDYGAFGNEVRTHMREHETLQAAMRFGRDGNGAVVYVHTDTLPDWVPLAGEGRVVTTWSDGMRQVIDAIGDLEEWTTAQIADHPNVDIGVRQVRDHLTTLFERGAVEREYDGLRFVWQDDGLHRVGEHGDVELDPIDLDDLGAEESAELARKTIYRWEFRTSQRSSSSDGPNGGETAGSSSSTTSSTVSDGVDPGDTGV